MKRERNEILRNAFIEADIEYFDRVTQQSEVEWVPSKEFERKMKRLIRKQRHPLSTCLMTNGKKIACALLVIATLMSTMLGVEAIRRPVLEFFTNICDRFSSTFVLQERSVDGLQSIETDYSPIWIPDNYRTHSVIETADYTQISYISDDGEKILFTKQSVNSTHCYYDTESTDLCLINIGPYKGRYFINKGSLNIYWFTNEYSFALSVPEHFTLDEAIKIAESVKAN